MRCGNLFSARISDAELLKLAGNDPPEVVCETCWQRLMEVEDEASSLRLYRDERSD
jgi:hypothetical protein